MRVMLVAMIYLALNVRYMGSENLTITTYYPSPYGAYVTILTTRNTYLAKSGGTVWVGDVSKYSNPPSSHNGWLRVVGWAEADDFYIRNIKKWASQIFPQFQVITFPYADCNTYCCPEGYIVIGAGGVTNGEKNLNTLPVNERCMWFREGGACAQWGTGWLSCVKK